MQFEVPCSWARVRSLALHVTFTLWSASIASAGASIWPSSASPSIPFYADKSVELGVKLRSDVAGTITGVRFYKGIGSTGQHTGTLWTAGGTLLATGTFVNETASGWQELLFSTPVPISANTTYIASYHANNGFAVDVGYFVGRGVDNAPLHALKAGVDGANGVYVYAGLMLSLPPWDHQPQTSQLFQQAYS